MEQKDQQAARAYASFLRQKIREAGLSQRETAIRAGFKGGPNMINKLDTGTLRVLEERRIAHELGYNVVWEPLAGRQAEKPSPEAQMELDDNIRRLIWLCKSTQEQRESLWMRRKMEADGTLRLPPVQQEIAERITRQRIELALLWQEIQRQFLALYGKEAGREKEHACVESLHKQGIDLYDHLYSFPVLQKK